MGEFDWPWQYSFPPFFTIQPNAATREKQVDVWCQLVLDYFRHRRLFKLGVQDASTSGLFSHAAIGRKLSHDGIETVLSELEKRGRIEWLDKKKETCFVYWKKPEEWAGDIWRWVEGTGRNHTVCTLAEVAEEEKEDFFGLDRDLMIKALKILEAKGKAEIMLYDGNEGVKFF